MKRKSGRWAKSYGSASGEISIVPGSIGAKSHSLRNCCTPANNTSRRTPFGSSDNTQPQLTHPRHHHAAQEAEVSFTQEAQRSPELVALVSIRPFSAQGTQCYDTHIFPAKMDGKGVDKSVPRRAHTREEMEAHVQAKSPRCSAHGPPISRSPRWL